LLFAFQFLSQLLLTYPSKEAEERVAKDRESTKRKTNRKKLITVSNSTQTKFISLITKHLSISLSFSLFTPGTRKIRKVEKEDEEEKRKFKEKSEE